MEKLVYKNSYNFFLFKTSWKVSLNVYKRLLKVNFFCIFLPSNQKLALKYSVFIKNDSIFFFSVSYPLDLTSFLSLENLKWNLTLCSVGWHQTLRMIRPHVNSTGSSVAGVGGRLFLRSPNLTASNFAALKSTKSKFSASKDLILSKTVSKS